MSQAARTSLAVMLVAALWSASCRTQPDVATTEASLVSNRVRVATVALSASRGEVFCSGVVLTPKVVLTAAHCIWHNGVVKKPFAVVSGKDVRFGGTYARVQTAVVHPDYDGFFGGPDIAVLGLAEAIASSSVSLELSRTEIRPGDDIAFVGFGETGDNPLGLRHAGTATVTRTDGLFFSYEPATCFGDSGGPIIVASPSGPQVAGIVSSASLLCREASATQTAQIAEWVHQTADELDPPGCASDGQCRLDCPFGDVDCACEEDGICQACQGEDEDCSFTCDTDGKCSEDCVVPDLDCGTTEVGQACSDSVECVSGVCFENICHQRCNIDPRVGCPPWLECSEVEPDVSVCLPTSDDKSSCKCVNTAKPTSFALILLLLAGALIARLCSGQSSSAPHQ